MSSQFDSSFWDIYGEFRSSSLNVQAVSVVFVYQQVEEYEAEAVMAANTATLSSVHTGNLSESQSNLIVILRLICAQAEVFYGLTIYRHFIEYS